MPAYFLHQNMRAFGGGVGAGAARLEAYLGNQLPPPWPASWPALPPAAYGFLRVRAAHLPVPLTPGPGANVAPLAVIGLTELTNANAARFSALQLRALLHHGAPGQVYMFYGGTSALGQVEYTAVAIPGWVQLLGLGRIALRFDGFPAIHELDVNVDIVNPPPAWITLPPQGVGCNLDVRMVVYAIVKLAASPPLAVGFIHNTYTLPTRFPTYERLPWVIDEILHNGMVQVPCVYIGGDFNVEPHEPTRRPPPRYPLYAYAQITGVAGVPIFGTRSRPILGGTTWGGHLYDYWLSNVDPNAPAPLVIGGLATPEASVDTSAWDGKKGFMSDHVATLLCVI